MTADELNGRVLRRVDPRHAKRGTYVRVLTITANGETALCHKGRLGLAGFIPTSSKAARIPVATLLDAERYVPAAAG